MPHTTVRTEISITVADETHVHSPIGSIVYLAASDTTGTTTGLFSVKIVGITQTGNGYRKITCRFVDNSFHLLNQEEEEQAWRKYTEQELCVITYNSTYYLSPASADGRRMIHKKGGESWEGRLTNLKFGESMVFEVIGATKPLRSSIVEEITPWSENQEKTE